MSNGYNPRHSDTYVYRTVGLPNGLFKAQVFCLSAGGRVCTSMENRFSSRGAAYRYAKGMAHKQAGKRCSVRAMKATD